MPDETKTKAQLRRELAALRRRVAELEARPAAAGPGQSGRFEQAAHSLAALESLPGLLETVVDKLAEERHLLRTLIDNMPDYIYVKDVESRFVLNNAASLRVLGATGQEEVTGKGDFDFYPADLAGYYYQDEQALLRSGRPLINKEEPHRDGQWILSTKVPLRDSQGDIIGLVGIGRDVTELKQARENLIVSRDALRRLIQQLPIGVQVFDPAGLCLDVNQAHLRIFGVERPDQLIGRYNLFADPLAAQVGTQAAGRQALAGRIVHLPEVHFDLGQADPRFARAQGQRILAITFFPVRNGHDEVIQIVALNEDITERKQLEAHLRQSQKLEAVGHMAGGIAHNFNNMLTAIMSHTGLALEALPPDHPAGRDLEGIDKTARRAAGLTQQLLAFTRRQVAQPRLLNLNELLAGMQTLLRQLINETIELVFRPAPELGLVKIDPNQLEQVVVNLALNARDAMPRGGQLTLETANVALGPETGLAPGDYILLAVRDTGLGIPKEIEAHLFDPFFTTKEVGQGTGLGLSTCFGIIKQHHGHISFESKWGQGTVFKVYLPRADSAPAAPPSPHRPALAGGGLEFRPPS